MQVSSITSAEYALRVSAVFACVRILSETIACLPKRVYRFSDKQEQANSAVEYLLNFAPNEYMDSVNFWVYLLNSVLILGNGYATIDRSNGGEIRLLPVHPSEVCNIRLVQDADTRRYTKLYCVRGVDVLDKDILHLMGPTLSQDALQGLSVIQRFALSTVQQGKLLEEYSDAAFRMGSNVSGAYEVPQTLSKDQRDNIRKELDTLHAGMSAGGRYAIVDGGAHLVPITLSPDDTKFIASKHFNIEEIARWHGVPLHLIQNGQQQSYNSNEQNGAAFQTYTLLPMCKRIEQQVNRKLFPSRDNYVEFDFNSLLRPSVKDRYAAYMQACGKPFKTVNEVRAEENLPPIDGGDVLANPLNMGAAAPQEEGGKDA
jgi:HK97 family phage portal protein